MRAPFQPTQMTVRRPLIIVLRISAMTIGLLAGSMQLGGISNVLGYDVSLQVEDMLDQAAKESPQWDSRQDAIRRDVHDIGFSIELAWKAAEHSRTAERKDYAEQALLILQRGTARGYFDPVKTKPVLALIRGLISDQAG